MAGQEGRLRRVNFTGDLRRVPALDGLRAVAIVLVLLTHTGTPGFETAGAVGVTAFFTLSGYLITSLLLEERACHGRIDLTAFYRRRAWRLFPPLAVVVVAVTAYWVFHPGFVEAQEAFGAVTYTTNWFLAYGHQFGGGALT